MNILFVSLGCDKNLVDTEVMLGLLAEKGHQMVDSEEMADVIVVNTLANTSGIVCDGAKSSCAAKIASAVDAGILAFYMHKNGQDFEEGDGLVATHAEKTIGNIGRLGKKGMKRTNEEIIKMMVGE